MSFIEFIQECHEDCSFNFASTLSEVEALRNELGGLPEELKDFLLESDGARIGDLVTIFSIHQRKGYTFRAIIDEWSDPEYVELYPNAQNILFFADDGMGGFFGYIKNSDGSFGKIVYWNHETDSVVPIHEEGLKGFLCTCEEYLE
jgi:hypothetical protein